MIEFNDLRHQQLRARVDFMKTKSPEKEIEALLLSSFIAELQRLHGPKIETVTASNIIQLTKQFIKNINETEKVAGASLRTTTERNVLLSFLPPQKTTDEMRIIVEATIKELNATTIKDFGKVLNAIKSNHDGTYDTEQVVTMIKTKLN